MQKITTAAQMRNMDRIAMHGVYAMAPAVLMENAGHAVAERAGAWLDGWDGKDVVLFCGKGNNGGDGWVAARELARAGCAVGYSSPNSAPSPMPRPFFPSLPMFRLLCG